MESLFRSVAVLDADAIQFECARPVPGAQVTLELGHAGGGPASSPLWLPESITGGGLLPLLPVVPLPPPPSVGVAPDEPLLVASPAAPVFPEPVLPVPELEPPVEPVADPLAAPLSVGSFTRGPQAGRATSATTGTRETSGRRETPSFIAEHYTTVTTRDRACKFARMRLPAFLVDTFAGMRRRRPFRVRTSTWFYVAVAVLASAPAWIVRYPPLEDLPFHVATLRVVHSYGDPAYGFSRDFFLNLGGTQYALYYVVGSFLAYFLGVTYAAVAMSCLYLGGTVLALRALLGALGKDERLCLFVVPLLVNVIFLYGLLPFMSGVPLMFLALAVAVPYVDRPTAGRGVALAILAVTVFYMHVVPYALFGIGFAAIFPWTSPRKWLPVAAAVVPSLLAVVWWVALSAQGKESAGALGAASKAILLREAIGAPFLVGRNRSGNITLSSTDEWHFIALLIVGLLAVGLSQGDRDGAKPGARALVAIPVACTILYFSTGSYLGDVWLLSERFPVPGMMSIIPLNANATRRARVGRHRARSRRRDFLHRQRLPPLHRFSAR